MLGNKIKVRVRVQKNGVFLERGGRDKNIGMRYGNTLSS